MKIKSLLFVFVMNSAIGFATTWYVPDDYSKIQDAIDVAVNGDTVIVREGIYEEEINFLGKAITVTSEQGSANTIIDGQNIYNGHGVRFENGEGADSILNGFTIADFENSLENGGGMVINGSSPTVTNCVFLRNYVGWVDAGRGAGIFMINYASPIIENCQFVENYAEIYGGGISACGWSTPTVTNCNFVRNYSSWGSGICVVDYSTLTMTGSTFFENDNNNHEGAALRIDSYSSATVTNSILWNDIPDEIYVGNLSTISVAHSDVKGGFSGPGNIDADPLFVDAANNDFHLTFNSPCIDAGDNGAPGIPSEDFEGDIRIFDGNSDGLAVVDMGWDEINGLNVPPVYPTIQDAIYSASNGDNVLVAAGTYKENIDFLGKAIHVVGLEGTETTIIDGNQVGSVAVFASGEGPDSILEGFTLTNGMAEEGGGVFCYNASPTLRKNNITGNAATSGDGGGIFCLGSSAVIDKNTITQNTTSARGGGIGCESSSPCIEGNEIHGNQALIGGGVSCLCSSPKILNNILYDNCAECGGGLLAESISSPVVTNNTIYGNTALSSGGGIHGGSEFFTITNTILWNNDAPTDPQINGTNATVTHCDVQGGWPGTGNMVVDPLVLNPGMGDFHLSPDSPCLNKGDNDAPEIPVWDFEGNPRIMYFFVDMGADEFYGGHVIRVPFVVSTIQGAIDAAVDGDTVLVDAGTYFESIDFKGKAITVKSSSGFRFTTIDGNGSDAVVSFTQFEEKESILQGFTITNGHSSGICCENSSPIINNNIISGNGYYVGKGGGMYNYKSSPTVADCIFTENEANFGGGMYNEYSSPTVTNCTFSGNSAYNGGGMYNNNGSSSMIVTNCILWENIPYQIGGVGITLTYSCVQGGYSGTGNIDADPLFLDPLNDDYHLSYASPCIDAGDNYAPSLPTTDFEGDPRIFPGNGKGYLVGSPPQSAIVDMGADEYCLLKRQNPILK